MKKKIAVLLSAILLLTGTAVDYNYQPASVKAAEVGTISTTTTADDYVNMDELSGWATVAAEGLDGVTGGGDATPVIVETSEDFETLVGDNIPRVLVVKGTINVVDSAGCGMKVGNNKTIVGYDENATLYGGLRIHNVNNIIINNLNIQGAWPNNRTPDDCLEIRGSHHIWLNHLNVWDSADGNVDITIGSDYITVSWCKFWYTEKTVNGVDTDGDGTVDKVQDHRLSNLIGSGAGDHDDTDLGKFHVTYHHNWFADRLDQRMPRVMYGRVHIYNNYYTCSGNYYCVGADSYASVLLESNYFYNVNNPHIFSYKDGPLPASITARNNAYKGSTSGTKDSGQKISDKTVTPFETTIYDYYINDADDVPTVVESYAGTYSATDTAPEKGTLVKGVEDEDTSTKDPLPSDETEEKVNDNPITYDSESDTYTYHGQNSDDSNAFYEIENPFAKKDFSETPTYDSNGYPVWEMGATISYWVKVPDDANDAAVLNFNLENDRQIQRSDYAKYLLCQAYSESDDAYSMGTKKTYVTSSGREFDVLVGYGEKVCYNPEYPSAGCYEATDDGGAFYAYEKGTDSTDTSNWKYLNYIGTGMYESYGKCFDEEGGENSKLQEAYIDGSLSLYASGSVGYKQDNRTGIQINPNLSNYGNSIVAQDFNQFFYFGNGNGGSGTDGKKTDTPTMSQKDEWHFVVVVIKNDWIQYYIDGIEMDSNYINYFNNSAEYHTKMAGESFNLGYGHKKTYATNKPDIICQNGRTVLDFISDEDTVLTIGGMGAGASILSQDGFGTPDGTQVKDLEFYYMAVNPTCILEDKIDLTLAASGVEAPDKPLDPSNDNPITYDKSSDTYTYHGANSDGSNAYYKINNPFTTKNYSETPTYLNGYPVWKKGATISYWVKVPEGANDAAVLNFNLKNDRQMEQYDYAKYQVCQAYSASDTSYSMGTQKTYLTSTGCALTVLTGYGNNVCYNPNYPTTGCYKISSTATSIRAYEQGTDSTNESNWKYLSYIGDNLYESYGHRFDEEGGEKSKIQEAYINGSLSLYASGSVGYKQDDRTGVQLNPNLANYGNTIVAHDYNQFFYFGNGNGGTNVSGKGTSTPTMSEKNEWHFVVVVIQNDWIQYYMDGIEMNSSYINYFNMDGYIKYVAGDSFNLGYGHKKTYRSNNPSLKSRNGKTILDFISDEDTVLTIGGMGVGASILSQDGFTADGRESGFGTPDGTQVKDLEFYYMAVNPTCILENKIDLTLAESGIEAPDKSEKDETDSSPSDDPSDSTSPSPSPDPSPSNNPSAGTSSSPSANPSDGTSSSPSTNPSDGASSSPSASPSGSPSNEPNDNLLGDVNDDGDIDLEDVRITLRAALKIDNLDSDTKKTAADVNKDGSITIMDAQQLLRYAIKAIRTF